MIPGYRRVMFRLYVLGRVVDQRAVVLGMGGVDDQVADIAGVQAELAGRAEMAERPWMAEVEFWDGEHVRWGTDVDGMAVPVAVGLDRLVAALEARWS